MSDFKNAMIHGHVFGSRTAALLFVAGVAVGATTPAGAQGVRPSGTDAPAAPAAISGAPSSAYYCLTGNAANVHPLGWIEARTAYSVTFDANFAVASAIVRFNMADEASTIIRGLPEFNGTASTAGMMVLHVASNGQSGCYRFQAALTPPAPQLAGAALGSAPRERAGAPTRVRPAGDVERFAVSGAPSSGVHCVAGSPIPQVHEIGRVDTETRISVSFDVGAGFAPFIGVTTTSLEPDAGPGHWVVDDEIPGFNFLAPPGEHVVLYVAARSGAGCYRYKVEIQ